jgi:hypothetical protein
MKFRKRPIVVEAVRWTQYGDHMEVKPNYQDPDVPCKQCGEPLYHHGTCSTLEGDMLVCPDDWIITGIKGELYPCKPDIFEATYEPVE